MNKILYVFLFLCLVFLIGTAFMFTNPPAVHAQLMNMFPFWTPQPIPFGWPFYQWYRTPVSPRPFSLYPGYPGLSFPPAPVSSPFYVEPVLRGAMIAPTISLPVISPTAAPVTLILNAVDPTLLASNIAVLTTTVPVVFNLVVSTFQLPII